jgi:hypothetical protein
MGGDSAPMQVLGGTPSRQALGTLPLMEAAQAPQPRWHGGAQSQKQENDQGQQFVHRTTYVSRCV